MKLYAFHPGGHGQYSFFVCAESEDKAREIVTEHIHKNHMKTDRLPDYEADGWGTDYYEVEVLDVGQVAENSND